jgi:DNA-binding protein HU-beta
MPPAKKAAPVRKAAPAAKAAAPATKAASTGKSADAAKKAATAAKKAVPAAKKAAPAKAAAATKAAPQATVTLKQIAAELAEGHDLPKKQAEAVLGDLMALATRHLKNGDKLRLTGLGILQVQKRAARMGRNPATGEAIQIEASKKITFRPSKELKEAV